MKQPTVCVGFPDAYSAKKRRYSSTAVEFPIRDDLSAHSQGISGVFPTWMRTRRAPTYVRALGIAYDSTSKHLPQTHTTPSNHLSDTTRSPLKPRTKPYTASCKNQSNTRLSTPLRALIFAQIHPILVEICLEFAWDSLEVVHNQFNTHSTQLACSFKTTQSTQDSPIDTTQSTQNSPIDTTQSTQNSPIDTTQSSQESPIDTNQSSQDSPIVNVHSANDTNPTQLGQIKDTNPTHPRHQADSITTPIRLDLDKSRTPIRLIHDTKPTKPRHQTD